MNWHHHSESSLLEADVVDVAVPVIAIDADHVPDDQDSAWRSVRRRLHNDLRLAIISLCGALTVLTITPFGIYRLINGELTAAIADFAIVVILSAINLYAWKTGRTRGPALAIVATTSIACIAVTALLGTAAMFWAYTTIVMNFFLVDRRLALLASTALIAMLTFQGHGFTDPAHVFSFASTAMLVAMFSTIFASRTDVQHRQLQALASLDPLTGVGNRRLLDLELDAAARRHQGPHLVSAVVLLDLDHFKNVNDVHGHDAGDLVLIDFVRLLRSSLRRNDRLYRYGGEEFVLLLTGLEMADLHEVVAKIHTHVRQHLRSPSEPVTVSMGVAVLDEGEDWTAWLARADAVLYAAKRNGRDRVEYDSCELASVPLA